MSHNTLAVSTLWRRFGRWASVLSANRGLLFGGIIVVALVAFELFNYSTTDFALTDLLGDMRFGGVRWAAILAIAFCGMDFAGVARLFTPDRGQSPKTEVWYLLAAWVLAAAMNALLTWWGVSLALLSHTGLGNEVIGREALLGVVPVFVAALVVLIRVLIIGTFTLSANRLFSEAEAAAALRGPVRPQAAGRGAAARAAAVPPPPDEPGWDDASPALAMAAAGLRRTAQPRFVGRPEAPSPAFRPAPKPAARPGGEGGYEMGSRGQTPAG